MKTKFLKQVAVMAMMVGVAASAFAQGQINFFTFNADSNFGRVFNVDGTTPLAGSGFLGQLYGGSSNDRSTFQAIATPVAFLSGGGAGYINAGTVTVPNGAGGTTYFYELRAWNASSSSTWDQAVANGADRAFSQTIQITLGGGSPPAPVPTANGFANFSLVPEPSTYALGALGLGALLFVRRRK